jgi:signal transduction histidine kinase
MQDDGLGGADQSRGTGLQGLRDRVGALEGTLSVHSPSGEGTRVAARIPWRGVDEFLAGLA